MQLECQWPSLISHQPGRLIADGDLKHPGPREYFVVLHCTSDIWYQNQEKEHQRTRERKRKTDIEKMRATTRAEEAGAVARRSR